MNNMFDIKRVYLLIIRFLRMYTSPALIAFTAVSALLLVILLLTSIDLQINDETFLGITLPFLMLGGYIFSSMAYPELNSSVKGNFYLTLPASPLDRLAAGWLLTGPAYVILSMVLLFLLSLLTAIFGSTVFGYPFMLHNIFEENVIKVFGIYLVTQTLFLTGAAYFKRFNFFKVILSIVVVGFVVSAYSGILSLLVFGGSGFNGSFPGDADPITKAFFEQTFPDIAAFVFWGLMGPFFLLVTYFRIKEREV